MKDNIRFKLRKALLMEEKEATYEYGCVMAYLNVPKEWWDKIQDQIDEDDIMKGEEEDKDRYGREYEQHVTILYGIHSDVPDEEVEERIDKLEAPTVRLNKIGIFENEDFDVVKLDVESKDLTAANKMFKELDHTSQYPDYHAHVTIAYVKAGTGKKYVRELSDDESLSIKADKIVYSKPDGTKKEYKF